MFLIQIARASPEHGHAELHRVDANSKHSDSMGPDTGEDAPPGTGVGWLGWASSPTSVPPVPQARIKIKAPVNTHP